MWEIESFTKYLGGVPILAGLNPDIFPEGLHFIFITVGPRIEWRIMTRYTDREFEQLIIGGTLEAAYRKDWLHWFKENHHV